MINKAILLGNIGSDPEVKILDSGTSVASFSMATSESYKNKQGEKITNTEWHKIVIWNQSLVSFIENYLHKGDLIFIEGKIETKSYEKDGKTVYFTQINCFSVKLIKSKNSENNSQNNDNAQNTATEMVDDLTPNEGDDLPF